MLRVELTSDVDERLVVTTGRSTAQGSEGHAGRAGWRRLCVGFLATEALLCALATPALAGGAPLFVADPGNERIVDFSAGGSFAGAGGFATGVSGDAMSVCIRPCGQILVAQFS